METEEFVYVDRLNSAQDKAITDLFGAFVPERWPRYLPSEFPRRLTQTELTEVPTEAELKAAEKSLYRWWWEFLKESPDYPPKGKKKDPQISKLHKSFGELGDDFRGWWSRTGRNVFSEPYGPSVRVLYDSAWDGPDIDPDEDRLATDHEVLVVLVSKHLNQKNIIQDFRLALKEHHPGKELKEDYYKKADVALFRRGRRDAKAFSKILEVWRLAQKSQKPNWTQIGRQVARSKGALKEAKHMNKLARDYYKRAEKLIGHAARGDFPREE